MRALPVQQLVSPAHVHVSDEHSLVQCVAHLRLSSLSSCTDLRWRVYRRRAVGVLSTLNVRDPCPSGLRGFVGLRRRPIRVIVRAWTPQLLRTSHPPSSRRP
nr:MAG TPA: hypothetical protein [Caudoviricetes sp.]